MEAKVGVVIVNYNGLEDTKECIESLYTQDYKNFFVVVIDNHSTEDASCLKNYEKVLYSRQKTNVGFGIANNIGAEIAIEKGANFVLCLNNDTIASSTLIKNLLRYADEHTITTGAIYYYSDAECLWYGGGRISKWKGTFRHKNYTKNQYVTFISGCCMLVPSRFIMENGLFEPEYFMYYEDGDFSLKALQKKYQLFYVHTAILWHKVGKSADRVQGLKQYYLTRNRLYILKKYKNYFKKTSLWYFYITRYIQIGKQILSRKSAKLIIKGIEDCRNCRMGKVHK